MEVSDFSYKWTFDASEDMQLPELPTGCEATAAATLCRMQGALVTKTMIADSLPKSYDDFVNSFIGDPYSYEGWSCSAKAMTRTLNDIFFSREEFAAIELTGDRLGKLVLPSAVWVSIGLTDPGEPSMVSDGYKLFHNTHCVVIKNIDDNNVYAVDPLRGKVTYNRVIFEQIYNKMGREAVHVGTLDDIVRLTQERMNYGS